MDASTLFTRLETATASFRSLERQLADPDVAADPKRLETIARERSRLEPLVLDFEALKQLEIEQAKLQKTKEEERQRIEREYAALQNPEKPEGNTPKRKRKPARKVIVTEASSARESEDEVEVVLPKPKKQPPLSREEIQYRRTYSQMFEM